MRDLVEHVEAELADLEARGERQPRRPASPVVVTANGERGRDGTKGFDHLRVPDVPRVNDEIRPAERFERLRAEQPVGIRDDTHPDPPATARGERALHAGTSGGA